MSPFLISAGNPILRSQQAERTCTTFSTPKTQIPERNETTTKRIPCPPENALALDRGFRGVPNHHAQCCLFATERRPNEKTQHCRNFWRWHRHVERRRLCSRHDGPHAQH